MIDLAAAEAKATQAEAEGGRSVAVSVSWLRQALQELRDGRAAEARLGQIFASRQTKPL